MTEEAEVARLIRAVRGRVPLDAAALLTREKPERIALVLAELPQALADRIQAHLPAELRHQSQEELADVIEGTVREIMEPAQAVVPLSMTVQQAIDFLRAHEAPQQVTYL